jgi:hypothetical protein
VQGRGRLRKLVRVPVCGVPADSCGVVNDAVWSRDGGSPPDFRIFIDCRSAAPPPAASERAWRPSFGPQIPAEARGS